MKPGDTLAHYELMGPIGSGGMGEVHLARDTKLDRGRFRPGPRTIGPLPA